MKKIKKGVYTTKINSVELTGKKGESHVEYYDGRTGVGFNTETLESYDHFIQEVEKYKYQIKIYND